MKNFIMVYYVEIGALTKIVVVLKLQYLIFI